LHGVFIIDENEDVYGFLNPSYINSTGTKKCEIQSYITNTLKKKKKKKKFIYILILMSKFNSKSTIITISCFKYLLTLLMNDIKVIDTYLSYPRLSLIHG